MKEKIPTYSICNLLGIHHTDQDIAVYSLKDFIYTHQNLIFPHRHSFYQLLIITEGKGQHIIDFVSYPTEKKMLYTLSPAQVHTWLFDENVDGILINLNEIYVSSCINKNANLKEMAFFSGKHQTSSHNLSAEFYNQVLPVFQNIQKEYLIENPIKNQVLKSLVMQLLFLFERELKIEQKINANTLNGNIFLQFEKLIEQNFATLKMPKQYAELMFITPNYLNSICNTIAGKSAGEIIRERILLEAKRLLVNSNYSINEVAYKLNFEDNSYFTKFFKKYVFKTPEEFRKENAY